MTTALAVEAFKVTAFTVATATGTERYWNAQAVEIDSTHVLIWWSFTDFSSSALGEIRATVVDVSSPTSPTFGSILHLLVGAIDHNVCARPVPGTQLILFGYGRDAFPNDNRAVAVTWDASTLALTEHGTVTLLSNENSGEPPPLIVPLSATRAFVFQTRLTFIVGFGFQRSVNWQLWSLTGTDFDTLLASGDDPVVPDSQLGSGGNTLRDAFLIGADVAVVPLAMISTPFGGDDEGAVCYIRNSDDTVTVGTVFFGLHASQLGHGVGGPTTDHRFLSDTGSNYKINTVNPATGGITSVTHPRAQNFTAVVAPIHVEGDFWFEPTGGGTLHPQVLAVDLALATGNTGAAVPSNTYGLGARAAAKVANHQYYVPETISDLILRVDLIDLHSAFPAYVGLQIDFTWLLSIIAMSWGWHMP